MRLSSVVYLALAGERQWHPICNTRSFAWSVQAALSLCSEHARAFGEHATQIGVAFVGSGCWQLCFSYETCAWSDVCRWSDEDDFAVFGCGLSVFGMSLAARSIPLILRPGCSGREVCDDDDECAFEFGGL